MKKTKMKKTLMRMKGMQEEEEDQLGRSNDPYDMNWWIMKNYNTQRRKKEERKNPMGAWLHVCEVNVQQAKHVQEMSVFYFTYYLFITIITIHLSPLHAFYCLLRTFIINKSKRGANIQYASPTHT